MPELLHRELTGAIIKAYYEVFNHTSRTYPEAIYEKALMRELPQNGYEVTRQDEYQIVYKDRVVGRQRLDLFVAREIVVENKAINTRLTGLNKAQTRSYLKTVGKQVGLLFNFGNTEPQFERVYWNPDEVIGDIAYDHLVVDGKAMVFPFAVTDIRSVHLDNIKDWLLMNELRLGIIANFNAVRLQTVIVRA